ncbi:MAG: hemerythrin domain-containing protein, partial [Spirochaetota bacterium]
RILESMIQRIKENRIDSIDDLKEMTGFLKLFADKCHHGKEETMLFPVMEKAGIRKEGGPIGEMLKEHAEGRGYIAEMTASLENTIFDKAAFTEAASRYISLLRDHIQKENTILFPLGDDKIPIDLQNGLLSSFEKFEEDVMGKGTHEKLHTLLHSLEKKYLRNGQTE